MKKRGFTLIELLVVVAIIAMLLAILMPALNKVKKIAQRVVCGTNLKGLGNAQVVYASDYDGQYACQGRSGAHTWTIGTANWANQAGNKDWAAPAEISVGASLYLLVRQADVSPKSFVCPSSNQVEFSGKNPSNMDIVDLWDFGSPNYTPPGASAAEGPRVSVSYAYHQPYSGGEGSSSTGSAGRRRADDQRSAAFAIMADRNLWFDSTLTDQAPTARTFMETKAHSAYPPSYLPYTGLNEREQVQVGNAQPHEREGQNVLFADGHNSFEKESFVGIRDDNIYTPWNSQNPPAASPAQWAAGKPLTGIANLKTGLWPMAMEDSYLVND